MYDQNEIQNNNSIPILLLLVCLLVGLLVLGASIFETPNVSLLTVSDHAKTSHAPHVSDIDMCFSGTGSSKSPWFIQKNGRYAQHCIDGTGYRYWRVSECSGNERVIVTQFKQELSKLTNYINSKEMKTTKPPPCK